MQRVKTRPGGSCELCGKSTAMECFRSKKGNEYCAKCFKTLHGYLVENESEQPTD